MKATMSLKINSRPTAAVASRPRFNGGSCRGDGHPSLEGPRHVPVVRERSWPKWLCHKGRGRSESGAVESDIRHFRPHFFFKNNPTKLLKTNARCPESDKTIPILGRPMVELQRHRDNYRAKVQRGVAAPQGLVLQDRLSLRRSDFLGLRTAGRPVAQSPRLLGTGAYGRGPLWGAGRSPLSRDRHGRLTEEE